MLNDASRSFRLRQQFGLCHCDLVHDDVRAFRKMNEVLAEARVAGDHDGPIPVVDSIAKGRLDQHAVVDVESRNLEVGVLIDDAFQDVLGADLSPARRKLLVVDPEANVFAERCCEVRHHVGRPCRPHHPKWVCAASIGRR